MAFNGSGIIDGTILIAIFGFIIGAIIGDIVQIMVVQVVYPEVTDALASAISVEGRWKGQQESQINTGRLLLDMLFGVSGAISLFGILKFFER